MSVFKSGFRSGRSKTTSCYSPRGTGIRTEPPEVCLGAPGIDLDGPHATFGGSFRPGDSGRGSKNSEKKD